MANCSERQFLDNAHQASQAASNHLEHFERDFRMLDAIRLKIAPRDKCNFCILDRDGGSRKGAAVKDRQFRDRIPWNVYRKNLLAAAHGSLENADFALRDDVQAIAGLAFREEQFSSSE